MRFHEILGEAPKNDPEELKRRMARTKGVLDKQDAEKAERSKEASRLGKYGAQTKALKKGMQDINKELRRDELDKREQQSSQQEQPTSSQSAGDHKVDMNKVDKDLILPFITQQIKDRKRKRGVDGDQGVEEKDVLDYAKEKFPNVSPEELEKVWKDLKGQSSSNMKAADMATQFAKSAPATAEPKKGPIELDVKDEPASEPEPRRNNTSSAKRSGGGISKTEVLGKVMSRVKDLSWKELKQFKKALES